MRTSLSDIRDTEQYVNGAMLPENALVFQARLLTEPLLRFNLRVQRKVYALVTLHHRRKLREETEQVHQKLFGDPSKADFQKKIFQLFKS